MNHTFCRRCLAATRVEQRKAGLKLPGLFWQGAAHCAYDARAKTISAELHKLEQGELP